MLNESEKVTRKKRIDLELKAAGWSIVSYYEGMDLSALTAHAVGELQMENGPADYALVVKGKLLGIG